MTSSTSSKRTSPSPAFHNHREPFGAAAATTSTGVLACDEWTYVSPMYVFADSSGGVVIPPSDLERVLAEARSIEAEDARSLEEISREDGPPQLSG